MVGSFEIPVRATASGLSIKEMRILEAIVLLCAYGEKKKDSGMKKHIAHVECRTSFIASECKIEIITQFR